MPLQSDVAVFNNVGPNSISYSMTHASNPTPGQANVGAVQLLAARLTNDLTIVSNSAAASSFNYYGATVNGISNTILSNESGKSLVLTSSGSGAARVSLSSNVDSVIQVNGSGNISILLPITGIGSRLVLKGTGSGAMSLQGANATYSGGTSIESNGTLLLQASGAAGTGVISNAGTLRVGADLSVTNQINLTTESAVYQRDFGTGSAYNVFRVTGNLSEAATTASILDGTASGTKTLTGSFTSSSGATNDAQRMGGIAQLSGGGGDIIVFQLSLTNLPSGSYLGWLDSGTWINATEGNSGTGLLALSNVQGSYASSGASATADYLGSWGYDAAQNSVWAILDHEGSFAAIAVPEPNVMMLFSAAVGFVLLRSRRRQR